MRQILTILIICFTNVIFGQVNLQSYFTKELGPGLAILASSGTFTGSMNNHIASQEVILTHKGYQYTSYYNEERRVVLARRQLCSNDWEFIVFDDYIQIANDRHNHISMGICPNDGTIHLAFDHHVDTLHYRKSIKGLASYPEQHTWSGGVFSDVRDYLIEGQTVTRMTYPTFFQTPDGHLSMGFRYRGSGNADSYIAFYNGKTHLWEDVHKFIDRSGIYKDPHHGNTTTYSRNAYPFDYVYSDDGILHSTWVWREESGSRYNHDLSYAWSPDYGMTWYNNDGVKVAECTESDTTYITIDSQDIHVRIIDSRFGMMNNGGQTIDHLNQPHLIATHRIEPRTGINPAFVSYHDGSFFHYWRDPTGTWHKELVPFMNDRRRSKLYSDEWGNMYLTFTERVEPSSASSENTVRVAIAKASENWDTWYMIYQGPHNCRANELHADRTRLKTQGIFSVPSHEYDAIVPNGPMHLTDLKTNIEHSTEVVIDPVQDAYVRGGSYASQNYGDVKQLIVKDAQGEENDRKVYIRFGLDKLTELSVINIQSAYLVLDIQQAESGFLTKQYDVFAVNDNWEEMQITWDNVPANEHYITSITGDSSRMKWDITGELLEAINQDSMLSFCIQKQDGSDHAIIKYFARESSASGLIPRIIIKAESSCYQNVGFITQVPGLAKEYPENEVRIYPNPCSSAAHLRYQIHDPSITIGRQRLADGDALGTGSRYLICDLYTISGTKIRRLLEQEQIPGEYEMEIDMRDLPGGVYVVRLQSTHHTIALPFILAK